MHLKSVTFHIDPDNDSGYPFDLPLIRGLSSIRFRSPVTFFAGDNGSGKSTILEALAAAVGSITVGAESVLTDPEMEPARRLARRMRLAWTVKTRKGFFLRAEDFLQFGKEMSRLRTEMLENIAEVERTYTRRSEYARALAMSPYRKSLMELEQRYGIDLNAQSHGESFLHLLQSRFTPGGLYLLDEPETPLSPMKQLTFISMLKEMIGQQAQFVIATHSPILLAFPGATIFSLEDDSLREVPYDELEHVQLTRSFLNNPERYLRHL
jgi:predicted ATPase